jgi:hypothetical protein
VESASGLAILVFRRDRFPRGVSCCISKGPAKSERANSYHSLRRCQICLCKVLNMNDCLAAHMLVDLLGLHQIFNLKSGRPVMLFLCHAVPLTVARFATNSDDHGTRVLCNASSLDCRTHEKAQPVERNMPSVAEKAARDANYSR